MSNKHLKREPHHISEKAWWYEDPVGITVFVELRNRGGYYVGTTQCVIRWGDLRAAITRKDKPATRAKRARRKP